MEIEIHLTNKLSNVYSELEKSPWRRIKRVMWLGSSEEILGRLVKESLPEEWLLSQTWKDEEGPERWEGGAFQSEATPGGKRARPGNNVEARDLLGD